jgi:Urm1 (Ubiquitin related modifier) protein
MLFDDQKRVSIDLPTAEAEGKPTLAFLIGYLCKNVMKDTRKELFVLDDHMCVLLCPLPPHFLHVCPCLTRTSLLFLRLIFASSAVTSQCRAMGKLDPDWHRVTRWS